jgi:Periplasmic binding protein
VTVEVIAADHENKPDLASSIARGWIANAGVNVIADVPFSSAGLAVNQATRGAARTLFIASGPGTSDLTGPACSPNTVHWTYDTYALANSVARAMSLRAAVLVESASSYKEDNRVFSHVMIGTNDIARSKSFYDAPIGANGGTLGVQDPKGRLIYAHRGGRLLITKPIDGEAATYANGGTIGFAVASSEEAEAWHKAGVDLCSSA